MISVCDLYEIILIVLIISMGQILLSYIADTSRTHARAHARAHTHTPPSPFRLSLFDWSVAPNREGVNAPVPRAINGRSLLHSNKHSRGRPGFAEVFGVFRVYKTARPNWAKRTHDRMCLQSIRTVWDISRDDRARIATCSLLTATDKLYYRYMK